jgi:hypothetical protein
MHVEQQNLATALYLYSLVYEMGKKRLNCGVVLVAILEGMALARPEYLQMVGGGLGIVRYLMKKWYLAENLMLEILAIAKMMTTKLLMMKMIAKMTIRSKMSWSKDLTQKRQIIKPSWSEMSLVQKMQRAQMA